MLAGLLVNAEVVDGEQAVVLAAPATHRRMLDFELVDLLGAQQRRLRARRAVTRQQRGTPRRPMLPAMSGRMASCSLRFSNARKTASLRKVPP